VRVPAHPGAVGSKRTSRAARCTRRWKAPGGVRQAEYSASQPARPRDGRNLLRLQIIVQTRSGAKLAGSCTEGSPRRLSLSAPPGARSSRRRHPSAHRSRTARRAARRRRQGRPQGARAAGRSEAQSLDGVEHGATLISRWADPRRRAGGRASSPRGSPEERAGAPRTHESVRRAGKKGFTLRDGGGNSCGCGDRGPCTMTSSDLLPPPRPQ
jgi:hypothetical protein